MQDDRRDIRPELRETLEKGQAALEEIDETLQKWVTERPLLLLGGTLVAGFLAGRVLGRRL